MSKLSTWKTILFFSIFCAATAIASPAQTGCSVASPCFTTLVSFNGTDGYEPFYGSLTQGRDGNFYGTTSAGGANSNTSICNPSPGCGSVFKITPGAMLTTLYSFCAQTNCTDGALPYGGLVLATNGNFYGTTRRGGTGSACGSYGCGTVFEITPGGTLTTLHSFDRYPDGAFPIAGLVQAPNANFYGTAPNGGAYGPGTVFEMTQGGTLTTLYSFCSQTGCPD